MEELVPYIKILLAGAGLYLGLATVIGVMGFLIAVALMVSVIRGNRPTGFR